MYKAIDVARYVVQKCIDLGHPITNVQLQLLLAYIQPDWDEGRLVFADNIERWDFGPCIPNVYYEYGNNGSLPIDVAGKGEPIDPEDAEKFNWEVIWYLVCVLRDGRVLSEIAKREGRCVNVGAANRLG